MRHCSWLLLLYGLPTKRTAERVSLWRKLKKCGAFQLKTSAYVLPDSPTHYERFQWLAKQIQDGGGDATLIRVASIEGVSNEQVIQWFVDARSVEYRELAAAGRDVLKRFSKREALAEEWEKLQKRFAEIRETDYFNAAAAEDTRMTLGLIERRLAPRNDKNVLPKLKTSHFRGKTWLTRPRPGIDRSGSAWLIRKFIDPRARFIFALDPAKAPQALPFDMINAEFSHHGDECTFETLVKRFGIQDAAVGQIAEMVHDADLEDAKFHRSECIGINAVLGGWAKSSMTDAELLSKGMDCFEGLYRALRK
jgi:hypothetical protein